MGPVSSNSLGPRELDKPGIRFLPSRGQKRLRFCAAGWASSCQGGQILVTAELVANRTYVELEKAGLGVKSLPPRLLSSITTAIWRCIRPADSDLLEGRQATRNSTPVRASGDKASSCNSNPTGRYADTPGRHHDHHGRRLSPRSFGFVDVSASALRFRTAKVALPFRRCAMDGCLVSSCGMTLAARRRT
mgnify:CR=1 FL=1